ncbi:class I SAM-dependent methyltransferase [Dysgonomonas sp. HGC4]|uniref:class I SAM-dependent methyltransferase n=1 Tax=Dysgonomonas sp. HGC4 TaxID=1658009 RepID=UPI0006815FC9|nr:class I SAM-dependent methyltransferase [Dysgonomonas sp. HGC4]MBD8349792.1 methyltransferase domain-containing protein [Dysgonomonas sp. HGC4]
MSNFSETNEDSKQRWETNADYWDSVMGQQSNYFHCNIVRPSVEKLLDSKENDLILDIACGNGNFSERLAQSGASVIAFDYSEKLIAHAKKRRADWLSKISFHVCDATDYSQLLSLRGKRPFDKAVSNMAIMDISDIEPLLKAVYEMLKTGGVFVFATHHPCFERPEGRYMTAYAHEDIAIEGQPVLHYYYHRPLNDLLRQCFEVGFVMDGFIEEVDKNKEYPIIAIVRLRKI